MPKTRIDMIGILTHHFEEMFKFYSEVMEFKVKLKMDHFAEFENDGVRFALSTNEVMQQATDQEEYAKKKSGHSFELAFRSDSPEKVDEDYKKLIEKGAKPIKDPTDMPWGQRTAFFADPDGNIHEIFADIQK